MISLGRLQQQQYGRQASSPPCTAVIPSSGSFTNTYMKQRGIPDQPLPSLNADMAHVWTIQQQPTTPRKRLYLDRPANQVHTRGYHTSRARLAPLKTAAILEQPSTSTSSSSRDSVLRSVLRQKHIMSVSSSDSTSTATPRYTTAPASKHRYNTTSSQRQDAASSNGSQTTRYVATSSSARSFKTSSKSKGTSSIESRDGSYTGTI